MESADTYTIPSIRSEDALFASAPDKECYFEEHATHCHSDLDISTSATSSNNSAYQVAPPILPVMTVNSMQRSVIAVLQLCSKRH
jgi:hypothetical protein